MLQHGLDLGGGTDLERGYWDVRPCRPPFHAFPEVRKGPISSKRVSSQDPFLTKFRNLASTASIFAQILALKPPNFDIFNSHAPPFGNFQFTSPRIWKFSVLKPPLSEANISLQAPHFRNLDHTPLPEKKLSALLPFKYEIPCVQMPAAPPPFATLEDATVASSGKLSLRCQTLYLKFEENNIFFLSSCHLKDKILY